MVLTVALCAVVAHAHFTVTTTDGKEHEVSYSKKSVNKKGVTLNSGDRLEFSDIDTIATDDFDAYERAVMSTAKAGAENVTVKFTGNENVNALRLEKLEKKRKGAGAARGAGGMMMLLGVLSGSRELAAVGVATYGAGTIKRDLNSEKMITAQNEAIKDLQGQQQQLSEADSLEAQFRVEYGDENVDSLIALIDGNHERAMALAGVGETAKDANHRMSAVWMKAIILADQGNTEELNKEYERLIVLDPEVESVEDGEKWMELLLKDLSDFREAA